MIRSRRECAVSGWLMSGVERDPAKAVAEEEPDQQREGEEADNSTNNAYNTSS